ncbi:hypothetical protein [Anatilimnocola floriformis]|uniref:hypothetical protein n=1 Tax=Anatilimnocola floriformis TaxID=2948575 RepID=UPI0020C26114|nr:hypothetical protein [Anatilimnocola floriformis]
MKDWILATTTALVAVAGLTVYSPPASAVEPQREAAPRTKIFPTAYAWASSMRQDAAAPAPALRPAIAGNNSIGHVEERGGPMIAETAWNPEHQYAGYVYSPGACDHTPPCVNHLWDGYCQRPHRCNLGHHLHRCCGVATNGCSTCGGGAAISSGDSGCGCGGGVSFGGCHGCRLHGTRYFNNPIGFGGCSSCSTCAAPAPVCSSCNTGYGLGHFGHKCRSWFGNLCNACDGGMSCGCSDGIGGGMIDGGAGNAPEVVPTPAKDVPTPTADDAKSARKTINRYVPWSLK